MLETQDVDEGGELRFFALNELPEDQMIPAVKAEVELYKKFLETGTFQIL